MHTYVYIYIYTHHIYMYVYIWADEGWKLVWCVETASRGSRLALAIDSWNAGRQREKNRDIVAKGWEVDGILLKWYCSKSRFRWNRTPLLFTVVHAYTKKLRPIIVFLLSQRNSMRFPTVFRQPLTDSLQLSDYTKTYKNDNAKGAHHGCGPLLRRLRGEEGPELLQATTNMKSELTKKLQSN